MNEVAEALMVVMLVLGFTFLFAVFRDLRR